MIRIIRGFFYTGVVVSALGEVPPEPADAAIVNSRASPVSYSNLVGNYGDKCGIFFLHYIIVMTTTVEVHYLYHPLWRNLRQRVWYTTLSEDSDSCVTPESNRRTPENPWDSSPPHGGGETKAGAVNAASSILYRIIPCACHTSIRIRDLMVSVMVVFCRCIVLYCVLSCLRMCCLCILSCMVHIHVWGHLSWQYLSWPSNYA